jgi:acetamidase/formamidase
VTTHHLESVVATTTDVFCRDAAPVARVAPGDTLVVHSLDASGYLEPQRAPGEPRPRLRPGARGHCLVGPIAVEGAAPGSVLSVHLRSLRPDAWGWTVAAARDTPITRRLGLDPAVPSWLLWRLDAAAGTGTDHRGRRVRLRPFLGVIGMPPDAAGDHSTVPPRSEGGGNIDCRDLTAGSTLFLPVTVQGAMLCLGDGHAAQGHGEVAGTAIECGMTTELVVDLVTDPPTTGIHADTPTGRLTFGFDRDLNEATGAALDAMVTWMATLLGVDRGEALAVASATVDLHVTQVANEVWGVHASLAHDAFVG